MKNVKGYVWIGNIDSIKVFLGPDVERRGVGYANFETNGLIPFDSMKSACVMRCRILRRGDFQKLDLAAICMTVAQTEREVYTLKNRHDLVVVKIGERIGNFQTHELLGPPVEARLVLYPSLPAALVVDNGFQTFGDFEAALCIGKEVNRQGGQPAWIATFDIRILGPR